MPSDTIKQLIADLQAGIAKLQTTVGNELNKLSAPLQAKVGKAYRDASQALGFFQAGDDALGLETGASAVEELAVAAAEVAAALAA